MIFISIEKCRSDGYVLWSSGITHSELTTQYGKMEEDIGEGGEKKVK